MAERHKWVFRARFRRGAYGWRSQPAIKRVKEAVSEIRKVARRDPLLGAEGAVLFLERVSPALELANLRSPYGHRRAVQPFDWIGGVASSRTTSSEEGVRVWRGIHSAIAHRAVDRR